MVATQVFKSSVTEGPRCMKHISHSTTYTEGTKIYSRINQKKKTVIWYILCCTTHRSHDKMTLTISMAFGLSIQCTTVLIPCFEPQGLKRHTYSTLLTMSSMQISIFNTCYKLNIHKTLTSKVRYRGHY